MKKKISTLAKRHFLDFSWVFSGKWVDFLAFISRFACDESDFGHFFFFGQSLPDFFDKAKNPSNCKETGQKQVKTGQNIFFFKSCTFRHLFSVPHSICCYFLATPATYFAKMAKKSKFHCIWLIFRKIALNQG